MRAREKDENVFILDETVMQKTTEPVACLPPLRCKHGKAGLLKSYVPSGKQQPWLCFSDYYHTNTNWSWKKNLKNEKNNHIPN